MSIEIPDLGFTPTLPAAIRNRAKASPEAEFLITENERWNFSDIESASARIACRMLAAGVGKGTRIGLYFSYSREWVIFWLAASRIGALVIPLSTIYAPMELARVIKFADVALLIAPPKIMKKDVPALLETALPTLKEQNGSELFLPEAPYLRSIWMSASTDRSWAQIFDPDAAPQISDPDFSFLERVEAEVVPSDPAIVVFTSGSSAEPKGVVHTHSSILWQSSFLPTLMTKRSEGKPPRLLCGMPFFWVGGILTLASSILGSIPLVIMEKFNPLTALQLIERERVTQFMGWPTLIRKVATHPEAHRYDLSSAPMIAQGVDVAFLNVPFPGVPAHRGMSEILGTFVCIETRVIDPETGLDVPLGEDGELTLRGPGMMDGYYKKSRRDIMDEEGWFRTGDKVFRVDGDPRCFYRGRYSEMIKSAGANVAPREVEAVIEEFDEVAHCFVLGIPDAEKEEIVAAVVALREGATLDADALSKRARMFLSAYKVPQRWIFLSADQIPWLGSGKVDKIQLNRILTEPQKLPVA